MTLTAARSTPPALPTVSRLPIPTGPGYLGVPVHRALRNLHTLNVSTLSDIGHMYEEELRPVEFVMLDVALSGTAYRRSPAGIGQ